MIPDLTHTFTVRQPSCLDRCQAACPAHASTPSGVMVTGCSSPSRSNRGDQLRKIAISVRWRVPMVMRIDSAFQTQ